MSFPLLLAMLRIEAAIIVIAAIGWLVTEIRTLTRSGGAAPPER